MEAPNGSKDPAILKLKISGTIKQSSDKNQSNKCDYCKDIFRVGYKRHVGLCKLYSNYINKIVTGLQCKICFTRLPKRAQIFRHIKFHHSKDLKSQTIYSKQKKSAESARDISYLNR